MKRTILLIAVAIAWLAAAAQSADPHMYMRAEIGMRDPFTNDDVYGVQFGAEGGVKLFRSLTLGLAMDYYTSTLNGEIDATVIAKGYPEDAYVMFTRGNVDYRVRSGFSGRLVIAYDILNFIPGNRWVEFSPEIGLGFFRKSETWYIERSISDIPWKLNAMVKDRFSLLFTLGGRIDVKLPKGWAVGVFARYDTYDYNWPIGLAVSKTF